MRVVVNLGGGYDIPPEDVEVPLEQPEEESRLIGQQNVRRISERGQLVQQNVPMGGRPSRDEIMVRYFDRMSMSMN